MTTNKDKKTIEGTTETDSSSKDSSDELTDFDWGNDSPNTSPNTSQMPTNKDKKTIEGTTETESSGQDSSDGLTDFDWGNASQEVIDGAPLNTSKVGTSGQSVQTDSKQSPYQIPKEYLNKMTGRERKWLVANGEKYSKEELDNAAKIYAKTHEDQDFFNTSYYFDPKTGLPKTLAYGEKPPRGTYVANDDEVYDFDDSSPAIRAINGMLAHGYNSILSLVKLPTNVARTAAGAITNDEDNFVNKFAQFIDNTFDEKKYHTSPQSNESFITPEMFDELDGTLDGFYNAAGKINFTMDNTFAAVGQITGMFAQYAMGGALLKGVGGTAKYAPYLRKFAISTVISIEESMNAVKDVEGYTEREKAFMVWGGAALNGLVEVIFGGAEMKLIGNGKLTLRTMIADEILKEAKKGTGKDALGIINRVSKTILGKVKDGTISTVKETSREMTEEVTQAVIQNLTQEGADISKDIISLEMDLVQSLLAKRRMQII